MDVYLENIKLGEVREDAKLYEVLNLLSTVGANPKGHYTGEIKDNEIHLRFA